MSLPWIILIMILLLGIQTSVLNRWGLLRIQYSRFFSKKSVFEGEEVEMVEQIVNKKILPVPWLRLESRIHQALKFQGQKDMEIVDEQFHRSLFSLMPYQKITRRHRVICSKRGYYKLDNASMTSGDPFGLNETHLNVKVSADMIVYPKLIPMEEIPLPSHSWLGDLVVHRWIIEDPFFFAGTREYAYGDTLNSINWKATARTGSLQVTKRDFTANHHLMIYLNFDMTEDIYMPITDKDLMERGISYAASIAQYAISQGISTGFGCNSYLSDRYIKSDPIKEGVRIEPLNSNGQLNYLLETMAKLAMDKSMNLHHFLQEDIDREVRNTDFLIITAFVSDRMNGLIRELESLGNAVEILWLEHEKDGAVMEDGEVYA